MKKVLKEIGITFLMTTLASGILIILASLGIATYVYAQDMDQTTSIETIRSIVDITQTPLLTLGLIIGLVVTKKLYKEE